MRSSVIREPIRQLLETIVDNRGMTVPAADNGIPLIATNCIKETSLYPTFENIRYVSEETHQTWFRAHLQPEDILFVNKGTPGRVCMVPDPVSFCAAQDMIGLRADRSKVYPRYLFAFLRSDWVKEKIRNYHVGLAIPHFKKQDLDSITVPKRSDAEQKVIGDLYFLLSEMVELNQRINAELEGMAKLLYDYWFVQFDFPLSAAQATALGKPHLTGHPYRASGGKMIYNESLKRDIPEGWQGGNILAVSDIGGGATPSKKAPEFWGGDVPFFTPTDAKSEPFCLDTEDHLSRLGLSNKATRLYPKGTLFITARGSVGKAMIISKEMAMNQSCYALCPNEGVGSAFLYFHTLSLMNHLRAKSSGSVFDSIVTNDLNFTPAVVPKSEQLAAFNQIAEPMFKSILTHQQQNQELTQLRDWLLPMLMNGQVTVG
jgi:type I restriction enzyme S subunit